MKEAASHYCYTVTWFLIMLSCYKCIQGYSISPRVIHMCPSGQVSLSCVSNGSLLEWTMKVRDSVIGQRLVSSEATSDDILALSVNQTTFSFTLESRQPFNVTLSVSNVSVDMMIFCTEFLDSGEQTNLNEVDIDVVHLSRPELITTELTFSGSNFSVHVQVLEGSVIKEEIPGFEYSIIFIAKPPLTIVAKNHSATLTLSYNVLYNVTVFGIMDICGYDGDSTTISFFHANCGTPTTPQNGYLHSYISTLEGSEVNITCQNGLAENKTTTCDHEGNWMPNPTDICTSDFGTIPFRFSMVKIITAVSAIIAILIMIVILLVCILCWWLCVHRSKATAHDPVHVRWHRSHTDEDTVTLSPSLDEDDFPE